MTSFSYQWSDSSKVVLLRSDGACIPADADNADYAEFLASGKTAAPYTPSDTNGI